MIGSCLVVEDRAETRAWLAGIVRSVFPMVRIGEAGNVATALTQIPCGNWDLALIDLGLPDGSGLEVLRALRAARPGAVCVITTVMGDDASVVGALAAGADGYLLKEAPQEQLRRHIEGLARGLPALSPAIARRIMDHFRHTGPVDAADVALTARERDVLALIGRGMRNSEVAAELGLTENTVAGYIKSIYRKLGIASRAEASWHATRMGLSSHQPNRPSKR